MEEEVARDIGSDVLWQCLLDIFLYFELLESYKCR